MAESTTPLNGVTSAGGVLDAIVRSKAIRLAESKRTIPFEQMMTEANSRQRTSLFEALRRDAINIIAEMKARSPSKGILREEFDPPAIASQYSEGGAAALSVLTEQDFFSGAPEHLRAVRDVVALPILRKDFIFDEYQLVEAAALGADAVLLIVAILKDRLLASLIEKAHELHLDALVEVHSEDEMKRAIDTGARLIGVNNRDLTTFDVNLDTSFDLGHFREPDRLLVSESGISSARSLRDLKAAGYDGFLVGEHFMRAADPGSALAKLIQEVNAL